MYSINMSAYILDIEVGFQAVALNTYMEMWSKCCARAYSNIPGHSREPANQPFGEKSRQEADEHYGEIPALRVAIQNDKAGAEEQIGHVAEDHGQQRYGHVPEPLVA